MTTERAAQYLRMSTEHQNYSLAYQAAAIAEYARRNGIEIVQTYEDPGISGLSLRNRPGLKRLLADVLERRSDYTAILVYDVSRWGRFQDPDESAHYEFLCRSAGVRVVYCAEIFDNDASLSSVLVKQLKRAMAAEYSRELSDKVSRAQHGLSVLGYWQGGPPGYGLRRCLVAPDGTRGLRLEDGQQKAIVGYRTVLVQGPPEEVAVVRRIYSMYLVWGLSIIAVVRALNEEGLSPAPGRRWTFHRVRRILRNEVYAGVLVWRRASTRLGAPAVHEDSVRSEGALEPIISRRRYELVQQQVRPRLKGLSDEELLSALRNILNDHGKLSRKIIDADLRAPGAGVYAQRFGSLTAAYARIGYRLSRQQALVVDRVRVVRPHRARKNIRLPDDELISILRMIKAERGYVSWDAIDSTPHVPRAGTFMKRFGGMRGVHRALAEDPS